jgi:L-tartrate/succinate antiporter
VIGYKEAWNVLTWLGTLQTLADGLREVGFLPWFSVRAAAAGTGLPPATALVLLIIVFFASHYLFASLTAHATAMLPALLTAGAGMPRMPTRPLALALCYAVGLMGVLNPYATGPAPIYFGAGYITRGEVWRLGAVFGAIFLASLLGLGVPWLLAVVR